MFGDIPWKLILLKTYNPFINKSEGIEVNKLETFFPLFVL